MRERGREGETEKKEHIDEGDQVPATRGGQCAVMTCSTHGPVERPFNPLTEPFSIDTRAIYQIPGGGHDMPRVRGGTACGAHL